jgi:hypothetical protein
MMRSGVEALMSGLAARLRLRGKCGHSTSRPSLGVDVLNGKTGCNEECQFVEVSSGTSNRTDGTVNTKKSALPLPLPFILAACGMNDASRMAAAVTEEPLLRLPL